jgi:hypothetical protein
MWFAALACVCSWIPHLTVVIPNVKFDSLKPHLTPGSHLNPLTKADGVEFPSVPSFSLQELNSQAYLHFHCKSWIPKRTFIVAARVEFPSVPSFSLQELKSQAHLHFSLQPSCLPLIIPLLTWWRIFVAHKWPFSRLSWGVNFTACGLLFRHLIQGSKRNEQDNCSATA